MSNKKLFAGERFLLTEHTGFWQVVSGRVEVYAVTRTEADFSFYQCYLVNREAGEAVFPALDEFKDIYMQVYALEDVELSFCTWQEAGLEEMRHLMRDWLRSLVRVSWLRLLADKGDDVLQQWRKESVLSKAESNEALLEEFGRHEGILAMLLGVRFGANDKRISRHIRRREMTRQLLMENGIRKLLGEEVLYSGSEVMEGGSSLVREATFAVRQVARKLVMPAENIALA
jgi:ATP-binding cassette subfamily C protein